jgi:hypothetical protein
MHPAGGTAGEGIEDRPAGIDHALARLRATLRRAATPGEPILR